MTNEPEFLTRRRFLAALAASVVAAGVSLPAGMPTEAVFPKVIAMNWYEMRYFTYKFRFADEASERAARKEMPQMFQPSEAALAV